jgi:hypothetical protein
MQSVEVVEYRKWIKESFPKEVIPNNTLPESANRSYASVANVKATEKEQESKNRTHHRKAKDNIETRAMQSVAYPLA